MRASMLGRVYGVNRAAQLADLAPYRRQLGVVVAATQRPGDELGDLCHLRLGHALRGDRRRTDAHAARDERRAWVVGDRVLVQRDSRPIEHDLRLLAGELGVELPEIDEHQVVVGATRHETEALRGQARRRGTARSARSAARRP